MFDPRLCDMLGGARLADEGIEWRQILVPFDETRHQAKAFERHFVQTPDGLGDDRSVIVDQNLGAATRNARMPSKMNFAHVRADKGFQITLGIQIEIGAAYE